MKKLDKENNHQTNDHHALKPRRQLGKWQQHRRGILRTWVFSILQQGQKNGYEIIKQIELASPENWRPSGSIYPLLDELCKEEIIRKREDGRYEITKKGKKEFEWPYEMQSRQPNSPDAAIDKMNSCLSYLEELKKVDPSKITTISDKLKKVRDRLTTILDTA